MFYNVLRLYILHIVAYCTLMWRVIGSIDIVIIALCFVIGTSTPLWIVLRKENLSCEKITKI